MDNNKKKRGRKPVSAKVRFNRLFRKSEDCWNWIGCLISNGYGSFKVNEGRPQLAHRVSYEMHVGKIPDGLCVLHHCDNRKCVNPSHLFLGTHRDNSEDCKEKDRNCRGERHGNVVLTENDVRHIRASKGKVKSSKLASDFKVSESTISAVWTRRAWKHLPD